MRLLHDAAHPDRRLALLPRLGYAARAVVYLIIGGLALLAALVPGGDLPDERGAIRELFGRPFGDVLLGVVALGLMAHSGWRIVQAVLDADRHGTSAKGLAVRGALLVAGLANASLALFAASLVLRLGAFGQGSRDWTPWLMAQPGGAYLVGAIGAAVVVAGAALAVKGIREEFRKRMQLPAQVGRWANPVCRFGLIARGIVVGIVGGLLIAATMGQASGRSKGLKEVLETLQDQPAGRSLLAVVSLGLIAFGVYSLLQALYRQIPGVDAGEAVRGTPLPRALRAAQGIQR